MLCVAWAGSRWCWTCGAENAHCSCTPSHHVFQNGDAARAGQLEGECMCSCVLAQPGPRDRPACSMGCVMKLFDEAPMRLSGSRLTISPAALGLLACLLADLPARRPVQTPPRSWVPPFRGFGGLGQQRLKIRPGPRRAWF